MKWPSILLACLLATSAWADDGDDLLVDLDMYTDDASDLLHTPAQKIRFLNQAKDEFAKALVFFKLDTIITAANVESYAMNTDAVGVLRSVYIKRGYERVFLKVVDHEQLTTMNQPDAEQILFAFVNQELRLSLHAIPPNAETLIVSYYAYPADVVDSGTEWNMPDGYEDACVRVAASKALFRTQTEWAIKTRQQLYEMGWADVERLKAPSTETRQEGDR